MRFELCSLQHSFAKVLRFVLAAYSYWCNFIRISYHSFLNLPCAGAQAALCSVTAKPLADHSVLTDASGLSLGPATHAQLFKFTAPESANSAISALLNPTPPGPCVLQGLRLVPARQLSDHWLLGAPLMVVPPDWEEADPQDGDQPDGDLAADQVFNSEHNDSTADRARAPGAAFPMPGRQAEVPAAASLVKACSMNSDPTHRDKLVIAALCQVLSESGCVLLARSCQDIETGRPALSSAFYVVRGSSGGQALLIRR